MCIMWFPSNTEAQRTSPISGWCITCVTVRFTAAARLLEYVDCLSRVLGDQYARFCGEEVVAISSPYPTSYLWAVGRVGAGFMAATRSLVPEPHRETACTACVKATSRGCTRSRLST
jgi:hypothetical protein